MEEVLTAYPEYSQLLASVIADPADDTVRLALADWLDEHSSPERAEFIRVQCEIAVMVRSDPNGYNDSRSKFAHRLHHELQPRESVLLDAHRPEWLRGPVCTAVGQHHGDVCNGGRIESPNAQFRRDCPACHGTGDAGGLLWPIFYSTERLIREPAGVSFERGFPFRVEVPRLADAIVTCDRCGGDGMAHGSDRPFEWSADVDYGKCVVCRGNRVVPSPWLAAVCRHHPIEEVVPLECDPYHSGPSAVGYAWGSPSESVQQYPHRLPQVIFDLLGGWKNRDAAEQQWKDYPTRELAVTALARAIVAFAHRSFSLTESPT